MGVLERALDPSVSLEVLEEAMRRLTELDAEGRVPAPPKAPAAVGAPAAPGALGTPAAPPVPAAPDKPEAVPPVEGTATV